MKKDPNSTQVNKTSKKTNKTTSNDKTKSALLDVLTSMEIDVLEARLREKKAELGKEILEKVKIFTEDEWFMKIPLGNQTRDIYKTQVNNYDDCLEYIRKNSHGERPVTQVFCCNARKQLLYYQYWSFGGYLEAIYYHGTKGNHSDKILLETPEDFIQIPYSGIISFHRYLQRRSRRE